MAGYAPGCVKTRKTGRQSQISVDFRSLPANTGSAERKSSLLMRRFQTISEFSHSLDPKLPLPALPPGLSFIGDLWGIGSYRPARADR